jgi:hypothetical protein
MRNCVKTHLVVDEINSSRVDDSSMVVRCCFIDSLFMLSIASIFEVDRVTDTFERRANVNSTATFDDKAINIVVNCPI